MKSVQQLSVPILQNKHALSLRKICKELETVERRIGSVRTSLQDTYQEESDKFFQSSLSFRACIILSRNNIKDLAALQKFIENNLNWKSIFLSTQDISLKFCDKKTLKEIERFAKENGIHFC